MLNTLDIKRLLRNVKHFGGVYAVDQLPLVFRKPQSYIINLDPSYKEGSHWVAINFDSYGGANYFDSFGQAPYGNVLTFIQRFATKGYTYSKNKLQDDISSMCGYFCVIFVLLANNPNKFNNLFKKCKTLKNERKLIYLIKNFID